MTERMDYAAAAPGGMKALGSVYGYVSQSGLPATLIDLVYLRVSQLNGCAYCIDIHSRELLNADVPVDKLLLVSAWDEGGSLFSDQEKAALKWAEVVTRVSDTHVPDDAYAKARAMFTEKQLANLTIAVGLMNAYSRLVISFRATPLAALQPQRREICQDATDARSIR